MTPAAKSPYAGYRFPGEIISPPVWLYFRLPLSRREPRDRAPVGAQVRAGLRQPDPAPAARSWRQMAPGRSVPDDQGNEALAVAGRRPGWGCARRPRPEAAGQEGRQAPAAQAAEEAGPGPSCPDH